MASREIGIHQDGDTWIVVFPSRETRDKKRSISFPKEAWEVIVGYLVPQHAAKAAPKRRDAIIRALEKRDGQSIGSLATESLEELGEDSEDQDLRKRMCGMINTTSESGLIVRRITEDGKEQFWLPEGHKKK